MKYEYQKEKKNLLHLFCGLSDSAEQPRLHGTFTYSTHPVLYRPVEHWFPRAVVTKQSSVANGHL